MSEPKRYFYEEVDGRIKARVNPEFEKLRRAKRYEIMLRYSKIPQDYWDYPFGTFDENMKVSKESFWNAREYARNPKAERFMNVSLYLHGPNSSGKTTVACAIGMEFIKRGMYVKYVHAGVLIQTLMTAISWGDSGDAARESVKEFDICDLIIIDDAFDDKKVLKYKNESGDMQVQAWDTFFRSRISNGTRFVITSNKKLIDLSHAYSPSLYELIARNSRELLFEDKILLIKKSKNAGIFLEKPPT